MRIITIQPAEVTDQIIEDGTELTRLPYPFHIREDGAIDRQDFWKGEPLALIGFQDQIDVLRVDLGLAEFWRYPQTAVGKYAITLDMDGTMNTHLVAIESVTVHEDA